METCPLDCRGVCRGEVALTIRGGYTEIRAAMDDPGDGLYRAFLLGPGGELLLGVLEPGGGKLRLCRRLYSRDVDRLGQPLRGEGRRSFAFETADAWRETRCPAELFTDPFLRCRLQNICRAWWRREEERLLLALPLEGGRPFPLEALFCLARPQRVEGVCCAVYAFLREEPVPS